LSQPATTIINSLPRFSGSKFVFSPGKTPPSGFSKAKERLDRHITSANGERIPAWTLHDIRRSVATGLAGLGVNLPVIERCLNHVSGSFGGIVSVYQKHSFADEMRAAPLSISQRDALAVTCHSAFIQQRFESFLG
jgi:integrase